MKAAVVKTLPAGPDSVKSCRRGFDKRNSAWLEGNLHAVLEFACTSDDPSSVQVAARRLSTNHIVCGAARLILARAILWPAVHTTNRIASPALCTSGEVGMVEEVEGIQSEFHGYLFRYLPSFVQ